MSGPTPFVAALREQLVAAAGREAAARRAAAIRRRRWSARVASGAVAAAIGIVAFAALVLPGADRAAAEVVVRVRAGEVQVTLVSVEQSPRRVETAVREAGLDVSIRGVHVGPSRVGRFVGDESTGPLPPELRPLHAGPGGFRGFVLPEGWSGTLHLLVGVPTPGDADYAVFSDALAPGEALACRDLAGRSAEEVSVALAPEDLLVRAEAHLDRGVVPLSAVELSAPPWAAWTVTAIDSVSARTVVLRLELPGTAPGRPVDPACRR